MSAPCSSAAPARAPRPTPLRRVLQVFLVLSLPVLWLAVGVRLVATPAFLWLEYHRPGFPADPWGMDLNERMTFGSYGLDYIMNLAPPEYLGGLVSPEGGLAFTPSEVSHMTDVQHVMQWGLLLAAVLLVLSALAGWYLHRTAPGTASAAWFWGGWLTVALLVVAAATALLGWEQFFTAFHSLFFSSGTWTFSVTDTLIRLYPTQFWVDAAVTVAIVALVGAFTTVLVTRRRALRSRS
ncbi:TIGR01906 family membrane protein [Kocuria rhizophila]|uniref:TIGR01906 family membrane protein n=1 Tax=Kocuria rhizophila TaxID=72000 RepID=UPI001EF3E09F|nr:TIGR01906 family membrane protein [Kocuria rhizophila]